MIFIHAVRAVRLGIDEVQAELAFIAVVGDILRAERLLILPFVMMISPLSSPHSGPSFLGSGLPPTRYTHPFLTLRDNFITILLICQLFASDLFMELSSFFAFSS